MLCCKFDEDFFILVFDPFSSEKSVIPFIFIMMQCIKCFVLQFYKVFFPFIAISVFRTLLNQGASREWQKQLMDFMGDGEGNMNATAIIDYFRPLRVFLKQYINTEDIKV